MKIYAISGLGADERVFKFLDLNYKIIPLNWVDNYKNESIESYSKRLAEKIDTEEEFAILGLSFGGLIATEMNKFLNPKTTILISSIETKNELPLIYKVGGKLNFTKLIPDNLLTKSNQFVEFLFGTKKKKLLNNIITESNPIFSKWALNALLTWQNTTRIKNVLKISGSKDKLFPPSKNAIIIEKGTHFMIVDKAQEVSKLINNYFKNI
ncbi:MAG: hypothetical protein ACPG4Y_04860 [Chitinophagales bacterium]|mgnify:CR=1 FL=1